MFNKDSFLKSNTINKFEWEEHKGLFLSELTIKEKFLIENTLLLNSIKQEDNRFKLSDESYFDSICLRVSFGLVDAHGNKVFTLDEIRNLKDKNFIDVANNKIIEVNDPKK